MVMFDELRCAFTGNPCGTDTWGNDKTCECTPCRQWLAAFNQGMEAARRVAPQHTCINTQAGMTVPPPCPACNPPPSIGGTFVWSGRATFDNQAQPLTRICTVCSGSGIYVDYAGPNTGPASAPCGACKGRGWLP